MTKEPVSRSPATAGDKLAFLRDHPIFGVLDADLLERVRAHALQKSFPHGSTIFSKGDPGGSLFVILEGQVKVVSFSSQGKNAVFNVLSAGDIFGEIALLDGGERTADVTAISDCKFMVIERRDFLPLVHSRPDIAQKLIETLCARLRNTSRQVEEVMFLDLAARLARALLRLRPADQTAGSFKLALTQTDLAQIIGASRESTNKQLREWEDSKWVRLDRGSLLVLKPDELSVLAGEDE